MNTIYSLSADDKAFISAYQHNVGNAPREIVELFLMMQDDHDAFYELHSEYYSSIADAHGMWFDAKQHFTKVTA